MQRWSNQELTSVNHSSDFLCPHCEAGSFEVIGVERHLGEQEEAQCALVMRCLICLGQFWHLAETESSSLQDLYPAPAVAAGKSEATVHEPSPNRRQESSPHPKHERA